MHRYNRIWLTLAVMLLPALLPQAHASAVIALEPADGLITGSPGTTVGWGFTLTASTYWVSIDSVSIENETSPLGGLSGGFTSYMDLLGGFSNGVTAPGQTWTLSFLPGSPGAGLGQYVIDPATPPGASDSGDFVIYFDEFSADPNTCASCYVDTLQLFDQNGNPPAFTIDVALTSTPEPTPALMVIIGCIALLAFGRPQRCDCPLWQRLLPFSD